MEVEEAAAAGGSGGGSPQQQAAQHLPPVGFDAADDDLAAIAAAAAADGMGPADDVASYHRRQQEELLAMYQRQAARQQGMVAATAAAHGPAAAAAEEHLEGGLSAEQEGLAVAGAGLGGAAAAAGVAGFVEEEPLDLPAGINLEEARMLEAAMLGIPYAGRIPDFSAAPAAAAPRSPGALEQQSIRQEQDQAYEESLALDRWGGGQRRGCASGGMVERRSTDVKGNRWGWGFHHGRQGGGAADVGRPGHGLQYVWSWEYVMVIGVLLAG